MENKTEFYLISEIRVEKVYLKATKELETIKKRTDELSKNGWLISSKKEENYILYFCYRKSELNNIIKDNYVSKLKQIDAIIQGIYAKNMKDRNESSLTDEESKEITKGLGIYGITKKYGETKMFKKEIFTYEDYNKFLNSEGLISTMMELWKEGVSLYHRFKNVGRMETERTALLNAQSTNDEKYVKGALQVLLPLYRENYDLYRWLAEDIKKMYYERHPKKKNNNKKETSPVEFKHKFYGNDEQISFNDLLTR